MGTRIQCNYRNDETEDVPFYVLKEVGERGCLYDSEIIKDPYPIDLSIKSTISENNSEFRTIRSAPEPIYHPTSLQPEIYYKAAYSLQNRTLFTLFKFKLTNTQIVNLGPIVGRYNTIAHFVDNNDSILPLVDIYQDVSDKILGIRSGRLAYFHSKFWIIIKNGNQFEARQVFVFNG